MAPARGEQVKITVKRPGESKVKVSAQGLSKELGIKAKYLGKFLQVEITQPAMASSGEAATAPDTSGFQDERAKTSYALGMNLATTLRKQAVEVDPDLLVQGFKDAYSVRQARLTEQELQAVMLELPRDVRREQLDLEAEKRRELAERNKREGEAFLVENQKREGVVSLPSGLQYQILKAGAGKKPAADDAVVCRYRGTFINGQVFDVLFERKPVSLPVKGVIKGWAEALKLMPVGSRWRLFIPAELAYGERGVKGVRGRKGVPGIEIAPNTTLIFDLELVEIHETASPGDDRGQGPEDRENRLGTRERPEDSCSSRPCGASRGKRTEDAKSFQVFGAAAVIERDALGADERHHAAGRGLDRGAGSLLLRRTRFQHVVYEQSRCDRDVSVLPGNVPIDPGSGRVHALAAGVAGV